MEVRASVIIKLGGSLLGVPDLASRLKNYLHDFSRPRPILIVGGGAAVDLLRDWDRVYNIGEEDCHWLALRVLSTNARLVEKIMPDELRLVDTPADCLDAWTTGRIPVYDPYHYIADIDEASHEPLPRRWRVTSDSIAASMAHHFGAPELVLLKSVTLPDRTSIVEAARDGIVDPHFPVVARHISRVAAYNLRAFQSEESLLFDPDGWEPPPEINDLEADSPESLRESDDE